MFFDFKDILQHFKFLNWRIRFLISRTGYYFRKYSNKMTNYYTSVEMDIWYSQCANWILNGYPSLQKAGKDIICTNQKREMPSVDKNIKYCDDTNNPVSCYDSVKCNILPIY